MPTAIHSLADNAIEQGMITVEKHQARVRINIGLKPTGGPRAVEASAHLRKLPAGASVLVYRTIKNMERPFYSIQHRPRDGCRRGSGREDHYSFKLCEARRKV